MRVLRCCCRFLYTTCSLRACTPPWKSPAITVVATLRTHRVRKVPRGIVNEKWETYPDWQGGDDRLARSGTQMLE
jgi:hypothetical protein